MPARTPVDLDARIGALTPRQAEVLGLTARGLTNEQIGAALGIARDTVRTHVTAVLAALDLNNRTEAAAAYLSWSAGPARVERVLERPAIAVLPLVTAGGDPGAAAIAAGLARDLVTLFSRWCWFPVLAHASSRDARSLGDTTPEIGRRLGAHFLVDGLLRAGPSAWRLTVAIVEAGHGRCVWSEGFDFARDELFAVQDALCAAVVGAAYPALIAATPPPRPARAHDLTGWQLAHGAAALQGARERDANARSQVGFEAAIARDPTLVIAHFGAGLAAYDAILNQWGPAGPARDRLAASTERCLALAPRTAEGHYLAARQAQTRGRHDGARAPLERAIAHNPSFAPAHALLAQVLDLAGEHDDGERRMQHACRLDPGSSLAGLAVGRFARGDHAAALLAAEHALARSARYPFAHALAAAAAWHAGDAAAAARHGAGLVAAHPGFTAQRFRRTFGADVAAVAAIADALEAITAGRLRGPA